MVLASSWPLFAGLAIAVLVYEKRRARFVGVEGALAWVPDRTLSLFIVFFEAYRFLVRNEPSTCFLLKPDGLLALGALRVNLMPLIWMCLMLAGLAWRLNVLREADAKYREHRVAMRFLIVIAAVGVPLCLYWLSFGSWQALLSFKIAYNVQYISRGLPVERY